MKLILFGIGFYIVFGAIGMALANKKVNASIAKQRWLKYGTYLLITSLMIFSILYRVLLFPAILIVLFGYYELIKTMRANKTAALKALLVFSVIVFGFIVFVVGAQNKFQLFLYFQVFTFDAFCQVTGQLAGKHAIAPRISPAKTIEGLAGGVFFCLLSSMLAAEWLGISALQSILLGLTSSCAAFAGDMLASWYKRVAGIKDYSNFLPGQGGFLDRFDSFLMAACWYTILALISSRIHEITF